MSFKMEQNIFIKAKLEKKKKEKRSGLSRISGPCSSRLHLHVIMGKHNMGPLKDGGPAGE